MLSKSLLIIGAKSDIAKATAETYAKQGYKLSLACRNSVELTDFSEHLRVCYQVEVELIEFDISQVDLHTEIISKMTELPDVVVTAVGYLGDQDKAQSNNDESELITHTNYTYPMLFLNLVSNAFEERGSGSIIGISSVAGDRGRKSNYVYGAAKAAFTAYLSGLRNRLADKGVHVVTVKPGFVDTQMTANMDLPKPLTAQPEQVAEAIFSADQKKKNTVYCLWMWRWIMLIIKHIPEFIFKKLSL